MADHRWQGFSHKELYERIHSGPGASASFASMERWQGVSAALSEINDELHRGISQSGAKWQGKAADMAQAGLNPIAAWADGASTGADVMRYSAELQAGYVSKARADMPAPVNVTAEQPGALVTGLTHLFGGQTDHEKQEAAQDAAERRAREVMSTYASSTTANTATLGQFTQPPQLQISGTGLTHGGGAQIGTAAVWGVGPNGTGGSATRGRTSSGTRGSTAPPPRGGTPAPGSTTRTSGTGTGTGAAPVKGSNTSLSSAGTTGTAGPSGTGAAGVGVPGQRTSSRSGSSTGSEVKQMEDGATATSGAAAMGTVMNQGHAAGVSGAAGSAMGPMGTVGASNNDQVHRRAVPMPQSFDPFGGMGGARKGEEEEDLEHKAADYLRERDDIYGVGSYALPVIGESTTD
ncbi:PPE domain-containing protein [Lentzea flaviverrucosa]|uniref:PPE family protein n=1 Tax=Lentzea flaviverrucosa TaxID=200379 RepID=A0A1H9TX04_9PSEU|nr:PPE domain-containing protein [Lentzea flaviverrucosa]RDI33430.1 PPE family protein [Lentzea flaviverrucosa]SES01656.1 PPE family protein [Lentzea flaviverrucosa]